MKFVRLTTALLVVGFLSLLVSTPASAAYQLSVSRLQLVLGPPTGLEKVHFNGTLTPDNGKLDLRVLPVSFSLSARLPLGSTTFFNVAIAAGGFTTADGANYSLAPAAANASGLSSFTLSWTGTGWAIELIADKATLADVDYSTVTTQIVIGINSGQSTNELTRAGSTWQLIN